MISLNAADAEIMRADPATPTTSACPQCDPSARVLPGVSLPHACSCGNVWQPLQVMTRAATCIAAESDGQADRILAAFIAPLENLAREM